MLRLERTQSHSVRMLRMERRELKTDGVRKTFESLDSFFESDPSSLESGIYQINHRLPLMVRWENRSCSNTVVTFTAAASNRLKTLPVFSGVKATEGLPCNTLMFSDPSMLLDVETTIAWFAGNRYQPDLQEDIARVIRSFSKDGKIILLGGSGGGYSALVQHSKLENATTLVFNPSTRIEARPIFRNYLNKMWGAEEQSVLPSNMILDVTKVFEYPVSGQVFYVQNSFDQNFVRNYMWPFAEKMHEENEVYFLTPFYAKGHVPLDSDSVHSLLTEIIEHDSWEERKKAVSSISLYGRRNIPTQVV